MKIILSRKGFDSKYGGYPSPILPDGRMVSLPIPSDADCRLYDEVLFDKGRSLVALMSELEIKPNRYGLTCHLDPDLQRGAVVRAPGWRSSLGQVGAAQTHLKNEGIGKGDLFLFFGWFCLTEIRDGKIQYKRGRDSQFHAVFGYLQVGEVFTVAGSRKLPDWLHDHPHAASARKCEPGNTIYAANDSLSILPRLPGGGPMRFTNANRLTEMGMTRSKWGLDPGIFKKVRISYHTEKSWKRDHFQSAKIGQEFVVDANEKVVAWAKALIGKSATK